MSYTFTVNECSYTGRTIPGSAWMRIFDDNTDEFVATYVPNRYTTTDGVAQGTWESIATGVELETLKALEPLVINACERRLTAFQNIKRQRTGKEIQWIQAKDYGQPPRSTAIEVYAKSLDENPLPDNITLFIGDDRIRIHPSLAEPIRHLLKSQAEFEN